MQSIRLILLDIQFVFNHECADLEKDILDCDIMGRGLSTLFLSIPQVSGKNQTFGIGNRGKYKVTKSPY